MSMGKKETVGRSAEETYKDIINLPHHTSPTRPRMSREARAAQFGSFDALTGYGAAVAETARLTESERELTEDMRAAIDATLHAVADHLSFAPEVEVTYFRPDERKAGGAYVTLHGVAKEIDAYERCLVLADGTKIPVERIWRLNKLG